MTDQKKSVTAVSGSRLEFMVARTPVIAHTVGEARPAMTVACGWRIILESSIRATKNCQRRAEVAAQGTSVVA